MLDSDCDQSHEQVFDMARKTYTPEERANAIQRVQNGETQKDVAADIGATAGTLNNWVKAADGTLTTTPNGIDAGDRMQYVVDTYGLDETEIATYADEHGLTVASISEWRERAINGLSDRSQDDFSDPMDVMQRAARQIQREQKDLQARIDKIRSI